MESNIIFGQMIDYLRKKNNLSMEQFGDIFGKNKSTVSRWIHGTRFPAIPEAEAIAKYFEIPFNILIFGAEGQERLFEINLELKEFRRSKLLGYAEQLCTEQKNELKEKNIHYILDYGAVSAGTGELLQEENPTEVEHNGIVPQHDFTVTVNGRSMEPILQDGERLFISNTKNARIGQIVIANVNNESFVKKLGEDRLISLNKEYDDIYINEHDKVDIIGVVVL